MAKQPEKITHAIESLQGNLPVARHLSESEKDALIVALGPLTAQSILKTKKTHSLARIPFLFSSIDTQLVVDLLANDVTESIETALKNKLAAKKLKKA